MKAYILQPPYSRDLDRADALFAERIRLLEACDADADLIVLPEYSDVPCVTETREETLALHERYTERLMDSCVAAAKRCHALVFVNALCPVDGNYRNTTFAFDRNGELVGRYFKRHLPPSEQETLALDSAYIREPSAPYMLETDEQILQFKAYAPDIPICVGALPPRRNIVERAIRFGCEKVQLFKPYFNEEMIRQAHEHGIRCNVFWSDDPEETKEFLAMGIDTVLTNDYNLVSQCVER